MRLLKDAKQAIDSGEKVAHFRAAGPVRKIDIARPISSNEEPGYL